MCVADQIYRHDVSTPLPSIGLEGVGQAAMQAPRNRQCTSAKPALHTCKGK